ncbi:hypothetical protein DSC45_27990 [Streptomyces sp. YIM 130001]|uniref:hypothetical protein n=1 Tax=Streptomyces sp. YIM 130001 TaxID=2259644 RepID=UPI000E6497EA|nr:hypothetical protein [Streptomyces sp. YIM 130001]RII11756.1 hypothetical protein DSC45_27990 [Streptomyces sp. YIM 130001]
MTQSGQGEEPQYPAARPAHEGVVLPADGGEPLISGGLPDQTVPAGGLPWGQPWGPGQDGTGGHGAAAQGGAGDASRGAAPQSDASYGAPSHGDASYGTAGYGDGSYAPASYATASYATASYGDASYGAPVYAQDAGGWEPQPGPGAAGAAGPAGPVPSAAEEPATQYIAPVPADEGATQYIAPIPADEGATQLIPPITAQTAHPGPMPGPDAPAPQPGPYPAPGAHAAPPAPSGPPAHAPAPAQRSGAHAAPRGPGAELPGALPPEQPVDATQFLGRRSDVPQRAPHAHRAPQPPSASGGDPDVEATQYIAPVPAQPPGAPYGIRPGAPGDRQPPPEFDSLFRSEPADGGGTDSTQQMPRFEVPQQSADQGGEPPRGRAVNRRAAAGGSGGSGGTGSKVPMVAAIGVAIAIVGLGAGVLINLAGGDDTSDEPGTVAATEPTEKSAEPTPSPTVDPGKQQAEKLDKLLEDSNNSRAAVIRSVELIKSCKNLPQAARDLRGAAKQRNGLVARLGELKVDKIPDNAKLTASLNKAWKASASADNHYAAWAGETCKGKGKNKKAGQTPHKRSGDRQSGVASASKKEAVATWNPLATKWQLTQRQPVDL